MHVSSNSYMNEYMKRRYRQRRELAFKILGGKCVLCGSVDNLEIDHIERSYQIFNFSKTWNCAIKDFIEELAYCQLLCKPHHKEKSDKEQSVEHGEGLTGKRNCYCDLCRPLKQKYNREW